MGLVLLLFALAGHAFLWIGLANRVNAIGLRRWIIKLITFGFFCCSVLIPLGVAWWYTKNPECLATLPWDAAALGANSGRIIAMYFVLCWIIVAVTLLRLVYLCHFFRPTLIVRSHECYRAEINPAAVAASPGELAHHLLTHLPLNEVLQLEVHRCTLEVPRLAPSLNGLSIVHLSDLHLTGRIGKAYFREVVRICNELEPDLVCITGDIVDHPKCFDWIPDTLGRLTARHGVYFVLGNHDRRVGSDRVRRLLEQNGLIDLGGRWISIEIGGMPVLLGGNERPWFDERDRQECFPHQESTAVLRIALAHTPDQLPWARENNADLMLAGHTHGGQIRIPPLGAIFSPTAEGVKYISGVFFAPPTILHVSRGVSGDVPMRWNCRPEITRLELRAAQK